MIVGVQQADPLGRRNAGSAFLVLGRPNSDQVVLDPVPGPGVIRIDGAARGDRAGTAVAPAGDVDGDDIPDVIIGAPRAHDGSGERRGAAYVLFGRALTKHVDLALLSSEGFRIAGPHFGRDVGKSVSTPRQGPRRAMLARTGARAYIRIQARFRPTKAWVRFQRQLSEDYSPTGPARRVPYRWRRVTSGGRTIAWDLRFRLSRRPGHLYPTAYGKWSQGSVAYEWHLRLR